MVTDPFAPKPQSPRQRLFVLLVKIGLVLSAACNIWFRGPLFGLLPFLIFTGVPILIAAFVLREVRAPRWLATPVIVFLSTGVSWLMTAPPGTKRVFTEYLKTGVPAAMRDPQRWNENWIRDPIYHFRFHTDDESVARLVADTWLSRVKFTEYDPPQRHMWPHRDLLFVPAWWDPGELRDPQLWRGVHVGGCAIELWYDDQAGLAYLSVSTL